MMKSKSNLKKTIVHWTQIVNIKKDLCTHSCSTTVISISETHFISPFDKEEQHTALCELLPQGFFRTVMELLDVQKASFISTYVKCTFLRSTCGLRAKNHQNNKNISISPSPPPQTSRDTTITSNLKVYIYIFYLKMEETWDGDHEQSVEEEDEGDILDIGEDEDEEMNERQGLLMRFCPHDSSMLYPQVRRKQFRLSVILWVQLF